MLVQSMRMFDISQSKGAVQVAVTVRHVKDYINYKQGLCKL